MLLITRVIDVQILTTKYFSFQYIYQYINHINHTKSHLNTVASNIVAESESLSGSDLVI